MTSVKVFSGKNIHFCTFFELESASNFEPLTAFGGGVDIRAESPLSD